MATLDAEDLANIVAAIEASAVLAKQAKLDAMHQDYFGLIDSVNLGEWCSLAKADVLGLATAGSNDTARVLTASTLWEIALSWPNRTLDPTVNSVALTDYETRPGWTFTARCCNWNRGRGEALYIIGTTTNGVTTEDALLVIFDDGVNSVIYVTGAWGLADGVTSRGLSRPLYNATTGRLLMLWRREPDLLMLSQWNGATGAFVSTVQIATDTIKLDNIYDTDGTSLYCHVITTGAVERLRKITIAGGAYTDALLDSVFSGYNGLACTSVQVYDERAYVQTDSRPVSTAAFDTTTLALRHLWPQGYGLGEGQGMCAGPDYLYQLAAYPDVVNIIDRTGARVRSFRLPDTPEFTRGITDAAEFPCVVFRRSTSMDTGLLVLTADTGGTPYLSRLLIDSTAAGQRSVTALGSPMQAGSAVTVNPAQATAGVLRARIAEGTEVQWSRGDSDRLTVSLGSDYAKVDAKFYLCIKADKKADNTTAIVNNEITITDAANVIGYIDITAAQMATVGSYYAEIERRDADGVSNPRTCWQAKWRIVQDVRQ